MHQYTGFEYLCIDVANQFGLDKELFAHRIQWVWDHMHDLESLVSGAENKPLYQKAVMALRRAQAGQPIGHVVHLDACCSGMQIMSALTGCVTGATNTGLVDPGKRADAYGILTETMADILGGAVEVSRKDNKQALMTVLYGSREEPKKIFGEDTPELNAFYQAAQAIAPGAWELLQLLLNSWRPYALMHSWKLPDGFDARVKVMVDKENRIEVDELDHASFTYNYSENEGTETGLSNVANVVHSVDGYVLRCMVRRCNYDEFATIAARNHIRFELRCREQGAGEVALETISDKVAYYKAQYERSGMADVVILPYLAGQQCMFLSDDHLHSLYAIVESMLEHDPFELVTVHDSFAAHPNYLNHVRQHYANILAELSESNVLTDLLNQLYDNPQGQYQKLSSNLGSLIRNSEYALS